MTDKPSTPSTPPVPDGPATLPPWLGRTRRLPGDYEPADVAWADQIHAEVCDAATRLTDEALELAASGLTGQAHAVAADGYSATDVGVSLRFAADQVTAEIKRLVRECVCGDCELRAAKHLLAVLALRIGAALHTGQAQ